MLERLLVAGSGGQGIVLIGKLLATVAVDSIEHVTFFPDYGAEVRGGTSSCRIVLSSDEIASPVVDQFDSMIIMNQGAIDGFLSQAAENCVVIINSSMCSVPQTFPVIPVEATGMANRLGDTRVANFIMLGAYLARKEILPVAGMEKGIAQVLAGKSQDLIELNRKAFHVGLELEPVRKDRGP